MSAFVRLEEGISNLDTVPAGRSLTIKRVGFALTATRTPASRCCPNRGGAMRSDLIHIHRSAALLRRWMARSREVGEASSLDLQIAEPHETHMSCFVRIADRR